MTTPWSAAAAPLALPPEPVALRLLGAELGEDVGSDGVDDVLGLVEAVVVRAIDGAVQAVSNVIRARVVPAAVELIDGDSLEAVAKYLDVRSLAPEGTGALLLLFLAPWPGEGHYRAEEREVG